MARATDVRVRKKFNGCLDASASHLHFFPSCSSASWQHSNENGRYAAILRDGVGISKTNEGLTSDQEASLRRTIQMRFCWFKKRKEKRKKRIQCEGCWNLALGWVEVISFAGRGQNPEIDTSRRWRPLWIIKHISTEKKSREHRGRKWHTSTISDGERKLT